MISDGCFRDGTSLTGKNFNKKYGLSKASRHVDEISFCGVHYTSNDDGNLALQNFGLRDLQFSLSADTTLKCSCQCTIYILMLKKEQWLWGQKYSI